MPGIVATGNGYQSGRAPVARATSVRTTAPAAHAITATARGVGRCCGVPGPRPRAETTRLHRLGQLQRFVEGGEDDRRGNRVEVAYAGVRSGRACAAPR